MISYEDDGFQTVPLFGSSNHEYVTNAEPLDPTTYAILTPLRPPSPSLIDKPIANSVGSDSGQGSMTGDVLDSLSVIPYSMSYVNGSSIGISGDDMNSYDFLEPLMPTAMLDSSGNIQPCSPAPAPVPVMAKTLSLFDHVTLLSASSSPCFEYDSFGSSTVPAFNDRVSYPPTSCFDSSTQSSSSPENSSDAFPSNGSYFAGQPPISVDSDDELDTRGIAEKVSSELRRYNISQVLFAQAVLGRSQGTLSDLLRNPKPWDKLKSGRETFARMQQWLQEPEKQRLAAFKRAGVKIDMANVKPEVYSAKPVNNFANSFNPARSHTGFSPSHSSGTPSNSNDKQRLAFNEEQRQILQKVFNNNHHPDRDTQMGLAAELGLPVSIVSNFFLNARRRFRYSFSRGGSNSSPGTFKHM